MTALTLPYDPGLALIRADRRLTQAAKNVAAALATTWARFKPSCWPSNASIAHAVGLANPISAQRALRLLERHGYVRRVPDPTNPTGRLIVLAWRLPRSVGAGADQGGITAPTERGSSTPRTELHDIVTHTPALARGEFRATPGAGDHPHPATDRPGDPTPQAEPVTVAASDGPARVPGPTPGAAAPCEPEPDAAEWPVPAAPEPGAAPALAFDPEAPLEALVSHIPGLPAGAAAALALVFCERLRVPGHDPMTSAPFWTKVIREVMGGKPVGRLRVAVEAAMSAKRRGGAVPGKIGAWAWRNLEALASSSRAAREPARVASRPVAAPASRPPEPRTREAIQADLDRAREHARRFGKGFVRVVWELEQELSGYDAGRGEGAG